VKELKENKETKSEFFVFVLDKMSARVILDDNDMDEEEEIQLARDYLILFKRKCSRMEGNDQEEYFENYNEYKKLKENHVIKVVMIGRNRNYHPQGVRGWYVWIKNDYGVFKRTLNEARKECPHRLSFFMNYWYPVQVERYLAWRWCADRRMVPLGDH